jgi:hypothetical protein
VQRLLLLPALAGPVAAVVLLFVPWFEAGDTFAALHGDKPGVVLEPSAFEASGTYAVALVVLAVAVAGAAVAAAGGRFVAWTVGAGCAVAAGLVALMLRMTPPDPGPGTYVTPGQAYDPTAAPILVMGCFLLAAAGCTAWALGAKRHA